VNTGIEKPGKIDTKKRDGAFTAGMKKNPMASEKKATDTPKNYLDVKVFVRSLQRAEGREDCFLGGRTDCDEIDCRWRKHCLENLPL
jgi:hypothetical protein